jgi:hypothetical protein
MARTVHRAVTMRRMSVVLALVVVGGSSTMAAAQPALVSAEAPPSSGADAVVSRLEPPLTAAIAVNPPVGWDGSAVAASAYLGVARHHALRLNVARYAHRANIAGELIAIADGGDGDEAYRIGSTFDIGIGYQYFPRRIYDGLSLEVGVLVRSVDHTTEDEFASPERMVTRGMGVAGRALIGWSWLVADRVFVATAAGAALGYFVGDETRTDTLFEGMETTGSYGRREVSVEGYVRIGFTWDAGR